MVNITTEESFEDEFDMKVSHDIAFEHPRQGVPEAESTILRIDHVDHGQSIFNDSQIVGNTLIERDESENGFENIKRAFKHK